MTENPFLATLLALGMWRHLEPKRKNFFHNYFLFSTQTKCERKIEKILISTKSYRPLEIGGLFDKFQTPFLVRNH
jgi:hypothetical protein